MPESALLLSRHESVVGRASVSDRMPQHQHTLMVHEEEHAVALLSLGPCLSLSLLRHPDKLLIIKVSFN